MAVMTSALITAFNRADLNELADKLREIAFGTLLDKLEKAADGLMPDGAITTAELANDVLSADAAGLAKMANGFLAASAGALAKMAAGFFAASDDARNKFADSFWSGAVGLGKFAADFFAASDDARNKFANNFWSGAAALGKFADAFLPGKKIDKTKFLICHVGTGVDASGGAQNATVTGVASGDKVILALNLTDNTNDTAKFAATANGANTVSQLNTDLSAKTLLWVVLSNQ